MATNAEYLERIGFPVDHVDFKCTCHKTGCMFCDGGLWACTKCGGFEGAMPTQCPNVDMTADQADAVYAGKLDFRHGEWVEKCSYFAPRGYEDFHKEFPPE